MRRLLVLGVLVLAGCSARAETDDGMELHAGVKDWDASLASRAGSSVIGSASVQSVTSPGYAGTTAAAVSIGRAQAGAQHPWHVHVGTCASGGAIFGDASAYPVLRVGSDGNATATANLAMGLDPDGSYHVNVHRSASDLGTIVACGDLTD